MPKRQIIVECGIASRISVHPGGSKPFLHVGHFCKLNQSIVLKIQVQSYWKSLADRLLQEFVMFSFVDIYLTKVLAKICDCARNLSSLQIFSSTLGLLPEVYH